MKPGELSGTKSGNIWKKKINEHETNVKNKNLRDFLYKGINEFKKGSLCRNNLVKDENGDLLANSHNILNRWKNTYVSFWMFVVLMMLWWNA
jgi:hypothetical protein